jgi:hypothetical protein
MDRKTAKKYLISVTALFVVTALISALIIFSLIASGISNVYLSVGQGALVSIACALIPSGSFTGFTVAFVRVKELTKFWKIMICVFPIVVVVAINIFGVVAIIPTVIYSIVRILKK